MELIFDKTVSFNEVNLQLINILNAGKFVPREGFPAIYIYEGTEETKLRILYCSRKLAEEIVAVLETGAYARAIAILEEEEGMVYVAFTSIADVELPSVLTMAVKGSC